jgi:hypothetical protein
MWCKKFVVGGASREIKLKIAAPCGKMKGPYALLLPGWAPGVPALPKRKNAKRSPPDRPGYEVVQLAEHRWYWRGFDDGREREVWAWVDVAKAEIGFAEEPADPISKRYEGGGLVLSLLRFRRGGAKGWHKRYPELYRRVSTVVDERWPET